MILAARAVAVLRAPTAEAFGEVGRALAAGGVRCAEVTLTSAGALEAVEQLRDAGLLPGVGSVMTAADVDAAAEAGARFVVSPGLFPEVLEAAGRRGLAAIPGVLTPTELASALALGAGLVKVFPAEPLGPEYIRHLLGPFPGARLMPTGGVTVESVPGYLAAGAAAVGLGGPLVGRGDLAAEEVTRRASRLAELVAAR